MNTDKLNKWLTLCANFGVLVGIILVALEINQANKTTYAEMVNNHNDRWITIDHSWQDAGFAAAWAKAVENPEALTVAEMIQLSGHLYAYLDHLNSYRRLEELGVLSAEATSFEDFVAKNTKVFFGNQFAQTWWQENKAIYGEPFVSIVDAQLAQVPANSDLKYFERLGTTRSE